MNLVETIAGATRYLDESGVASPRVDSEILLGYLLGLSRAELYARYDRSLAGREKRDYMLLLKRRRGGQPLQYITGEAGFMGMSLEVRPGVFIPRPETEVLVERALEVIPEEGDVLDVGTGCGNIAVSIAAVRPDVRITAVDSDPVAIELCRRNASLHGVADRLEAITGDIYGALCSRAGNGFDVIVSNPPYIPSGRVTDLPREVRDFEPHGALFGGIDGLDMAKEIVLGAPRHLRSGGWLVLELDEGQVRRMVDDLLWRWHSVEFFVDFTGRARVVRAAIGGF